MAQATRFGTTRDDPNLEQDIEVLEEAKIRENDKGINVLNRKRDECLTSYHPERIPPWFMYFMFSGTINKGYIKDGYFVKLKYSIVTGNQWQFISGNNSGEGQEACISQLLSKEMCWNYPVEGVYRTQDISGWPKLILWLEGPNWYGKNCVKGYGCVVQPNLEGNNMMRVNIYRPVPNNWWGRIFGYQHISRNPKTQKQEINVQTTGFGRDVTSVEYMGYVNIDITISLRNFENFNFKY